MVITIPGREDIRKAALKPHVSESESHLQSLSFGLSGMLLSPGLTTDLAENQASDVKGSTQT